MSSVNWSSIDLIECTRVRAYKSRLWLHKAVMFAKNGQSRGGGREKRTEEGEKKAKRAKIEQSRKIE